MLGLVIGYFFGLVGSMPLTGPIAVMVLRQALLGQYRKARLIAAGAALAEGIYCALAMFGFDVLARQYPVTVDYIRTGSGVLLILLGVFFLRSSKIDLSQNSDLPQATGFKRYLMLGFSIAIMNPVLMVSWAAAIAMFYSLTGIRFSLVDSILFPVAVPFGITTWFLILMYLLKRHKEKMGARLSAVLVKGMSLVLMAAGVYILIDRFTGRS